MPKFPKALVFVRPTSCTKRKIYNQRYNKQESVFNKVMYI